MILNSTFTDAWVILKKGIVIAPTKVCVEKMKQIREIRYQIQSIEFYEYRTEKHRLDSQCFCELKCE